MRRAVSIPNPFNFIFFIMREYVEFEVHGKVQRVFFRKHTKEQAKSLKLNGWCKNTPQGTVVGAIVGDTQSINQMIHWLQYKGSPKSVIKKLDVTKRIDADKASQTFHKFDIIK